MYQVKYIDWKGNERVTYITARSEKEAREQASVMQGMFKILSVEVD